MTPDIQAAREAAELMGYCEQDYMEFWFGGLAGDDGSILFIRRVDKFTGG